MGRCFQYAKAPTASLLAFLMLITPLAVQAQNQDIQNAIIEAEAAATSATNKILWLGAGLVGSWIGLGAAFLYKPNPPAIALLGKSPDYVAVYTDAYQEKAGSIQKKYALFGCGTCLVCYILYFALVVSVAASADPEPDPYYY